MNYDPVNHPKHYVEQSATIEPIEVLRFAPFDLGNALKYMIRAGHKDNELQDLKKAEWYLECAEQTRENTNSGIYEQFFDRYVPILCKFKGIPPIEAFNDPFTSRLGVLLEDVRNRITLIEK